MAFEVGAIVGSLQLKKDQWDQSIKKVKDDQKSLSGLVLRNSQQFKQMGMAMTVAGGAIVGAVGLMVKAYAGFDQSMTESLAIMGKVSDENRKAMADTALEMSTQTTFAAKELAAAYFFLASAGMDAAQSIKALPVVAKFAQAGAFDLATATDLLTDAQTALGLSSKDAEENQKNLIRVSDVLVGANTLANASVKQFAESLTNKAAAALVNVNKEMEEGVAVLAAYADKGVKGQLAGQRLTMMLNGLFDATRRNKKAWDEAGISLFEADGSMRELADIIQDMEGYLGVMTVKQREAALAALGFNLRTKDSILTLMGSSEKIRGWTADLKEMGGITEEVSDKQLQALNNQLTLLKNEVTKAAISIGKTLAPAIGNLIKDFKDVIAGVSEWISKHPKLTEFIAKSALAVGGLLAVLGPLVMMLPGLVVALPLVGAAFTALLGPLGLVIVAITATGIAINTLINIHKKKLDEEMDAMVEASKGHAQFWALRSKLIAEEIVTVEEWGEIYEKHGRDYKRVMVAISKLPEYKHIRDEWKKLKDAEIEWTESLGTTLIPKTRELSGVLDLAKSSLKSATHSFEAVLPPVRDMSGVLEQAVSDFEDVGDASGKTGDDVDDKWQDVSDAISRYWQTGIAEMIAGTSSMADFISNSFNILSVGIGSTVGNMVKDLVKGIGAMAGPVGAIVGGIVSSALSALGKLFGIKSKAEKEAEAAAKKAAEYERQLKSVTWATKRYGDISEETAKKIVESSKRMEQNIAILKHLGDVINDVGVNQKNINSLWIAAIEVIAKYEEGVFNAVDASENLDKSFKLLLEGAEDLGEEGSVAMTKFILAVRESGLEVRTVAEYTVSQLQRIPKALTDLVAGIPDYKEKFKSLNDEIARLKGELGGIEEGTAAYGEKTREIMALQRELVELTYRSERGYYKSGEEVRNLGNIALHTFNSLISSGMSWTDTVEQMKEPLAALRDKYKELGVGAGGALERLFDIVGITEKHKELFTSIEANKEILEALGNSGWLTADAMESMTKQTIDYYNRLKMAGAESEEALRAIAPTLQKIYDYAEAYGMEIDEATKARIEEARAIGLVKEAEIDRVKALGDLFGRFGDRVEKIFDRLGDRMEGAFEGAGTYAGRFQHGGVIEAGPRQPTLLTFGEGPQRERAVISHVGGAVMGEGGLTINADFNVETLAVRSDEDLEHIEEAFRRNVDGLSEKVAGHLRRFG